MIERHSNRLVRRPLRSARPRSRGTRRSVLPGRADARGSSAGRCPADRRPCGRISIARSIRSRRIRPVRQNVVSANRVKQRARVSGSPSSSASHVPPLRTESRRCHVTTHRGHGGPRAEDGRSLAIADPGLGERTREKLHRNGVAVHGGSHVGQLAERFGSDRPGRRGGDRNLEQGPGPSPRPPHRRRTQPQ